MQPLASWLCPFFKSISNFKAQCFGCVQRFGALRSLPRKTLVCGCIASLCLQKPAPRWLALHRPPASGLRNMSIPEKASRRCPLRVWGHWHSTWDFWDLRNFQKGSSGDFPSGQVFLERLGLGLSIAWLAMQVWIKEPARSKKRNLSRKCQQMLISNYEIQYIYIYICISGSGWGIAFFLLGCTVWQRSENSSNIRLRFVPSLGSQLRTLFKAQDTLRISLAGSLKVAQWCD